MLQARQGCAKDTPTAGLIRWPDLGGPVSAGLTNGVRHSGLAPGVITQDRGAHHFPVSLFRPCERVVEYPLFRITKSGPHGAVCRDWELLSSMDRAEVKPVGNGKSGIRALERAWHWQCSSTQQVADLIYLQAYRLSGHDENALPGTLLLERSCSS